ncbi:hypothetical protein M23134_07438 [Microscilla marina ATCC 23134]|uniref:Uncharacterized protein n=2 Tax=Microscilla marina TaxID=1027 RepID=A1ZES9_MICM2|nr:hypothetical protein M23134_07438 [Microscilla marina ATCC 23134]
MFVVLWFIIKVKQTTKTLTTMTLATDTNTANSLTKEELKQDLRKGIAQVAYTKLDGTLNVRKATLNFSLIPLKDHPNGAEYNPPKDKGWVNYYDLDKGEWRKLHIDRLKELNILFELNPVNEEFEYHTLRFKKLSYEAVKQQATAYFNQHKILTTLHLKKALREAGYWATQEKVSELMQELATREVDWNFSLQEGELFRLYYQEEEVEF